MPTASLVAEATRRSEAVWVGPPGGPARVLWHVWHEDALWLIGDGDEQPLPSLADRAEVTVRSRARPTDRVLTWTADVQQVAPGSDAWRRLAPLLAAVRLNSAAPGLAERWENRSTMLRLTPLAVGTESAGLDVAETDSVGRD